MVHFKKGRKLVLLTPPSPRLCRCLLHQTFTDNTVFVWLSIDWIYNTILRSLKLIKKKFCNASFGQMLFQIYDQNSWQMTSLKTFVTSSLWFKQFLVCNQKPNSHFQFEPSTCHFFKNFGNDVTSNDVINFFFFLNLNLQNNFYLKLGTFTTYGLGVG